jgi:pyruvate dehydrogenase complex dehydrogenase (E1) component
MSDERIAQSLDDSELWSETAADQLLNQTEYRKVHKGMSAREQKRWRHKVETRLWRSFKQEMALKAGASFSVQDVCEAVIDDVKLWLDAEWKAR